MLIVSQYLILFFHLKTIIINVNLYIQPVYIMKEIIFIQCMSSSNQIQSKPDDLSTYIKKELSTLLKQVQSTPPKKSSSLRKIHHIVQKSNIPLQDKLSIERKIQKVQSVIQRSQSLQKIHSTIQHSQSLQKIKTKKPINKYQKNLLYENMILQQTQLNLKSKLYNQKCQKKTQPKVQPQQFLNLIEIFENLRTQRLKDEYQIQSLSLKAQKLQRLIQLKKDNEAKYLQSLKISQKYHKKKQMLQQIRNEVKNAAMENRKKMVSVLMKKFSEVQQS